MITKIDVPISATLIYDSTTRRVMPKSIVWNGRIYKIIKVGLHHTYRTGRVLFHVFSAVSDTLFFRLVLNTETLHWRLEEIGDGESG